MPNSVGSTSRQPLVDGGQIYVPAVGEDVPLPPPGSASAPSGSTPSGPVDVNRGIGRRTRIAARGRPGDRGGDHRRARTRRAVLVVRRPRAGHGDRAVEARRSRRAGDHVMVPRESAQRRLLPVDDAAADAHGRDGQARPSPPPRCRPASRGSGARSRPTSPSDCASSDAPRGRRRGATSRPRPRRRSDTRCDQRTVRRWPAAPERRSSRRPVRPVRSTRHRRVAATGTRWHRGRPGSTAPRTVRTSGSVGGTSGDLR